MRRRAEESFEAGKIRPHRLQGVEKNLIEDRRVKTNPNRPPHKRVARVFFLFALLALAAAALSLLPPALRGERVAQAANPASGAIAQTGPVPPFAGTWTGTATGTGSGGGETTCVEGTNCDTFRLTVMPGDYTGKQIAIKIQFGGTLFPADDYDLYIHKCPTQASTVAQ